MRWRDEPTGRRSRVRHARRCAEWCAKARPALRRCAGSIGWRCRVPRFGSAGCSATTKSPRRRTASVWPVKEEFAWERMNRGSEKGGSKREKQGDLSIETRDITTSVSLFCRVTRRRTRASRRAETHLRRERELMRTLAHALRAHQFVFVFRLHLFTYPSISLIHKSLRVKAFLPKRFTFGTELHGCCPTCCEKEIVHNDDGANEGEGEGEGKRQKPSPLTHSA